MESKKIFISNRLPFNIHPETNEITRGSGGLVSALLGVSLAAPFYWMGFETNDEHAKKLEEQSHLVQENLILKTVLIEKSLYDSYYDKFSNDVLWPLFHYESQHTNFQRSAWDSYVEANKIMAEAILKIANDNDIIWIHDFHFFYLPKILKEAKPNLKIGVFLHTPFPSSEIFRQLPVREEFLSSVIKCDLIGFHTHSYLRHFSDSLKAIMGIDSSFFKAIIGQHHLHLGVYPVSIDSEGLKKKALSDNIEKKTLELKESITSLFLILGVDRLDYSKGLRLKMRGFSRFLKKYPELRGKVNLLQVAIPTRVTVPTYVALKNEIDKLVGEINGQYGQIDYVPVSYVYNSVDEESLLSLYKRADCALVTSKRDGMNLVAMEYAVCQSEEHPGVLILSEFTGAASLLGDALIINPWDEDSIADAIYKAYHMQLSEKLERCNGLQEILTKYSASKWAETFLSDLEMTSNQEIMPTIKIAPDFHHWPDKMKESLKTGKKLKLFLDYDGTLVGLKKKPDEAVIGHKMKELVADLNKKIEISVISGRSPEFLDSQFADLNLEMAAEHGAYYKNNNHQWISRVSTDIQSWLPEVIRVMESYAEKVPRSFVEIKNSSVVWHFRQSPEDFAMFQAKKLDEELQACLANLPVTVSIGSKIVEAKAIECNKGDYLRFKLDHMKDQADDSFIICLGDDKTDEDMFQMARERGLTIKIGNEESAAQYSLEGQNDVYPFLSGLKEYYESISQI